GACYNEVLVNGGDIADRRALNRCERMQKDAYGIRQRKAVRRIPVDRPGHEAFETRITSRVHQLVLPAEYSAFDQIVDRVLEVAVGGESASGGNGAGRHAKSHLCGGQRWEDVVGITVHRETLQQHFGHRDMEVSRAL